MLNKYILNGHEPVIENDLFAWAKWFETADRKVARSWVGTTMISTVFLGIDHSFLPGGRPILFESMVFTGKDHETVIYEERCSTWEEAEAMHKRMVNRVKRAHAKRDKNKIKSKKQKAFKNRKRKNR